MKKILKIAAITIVVALLLIQFYPRAAKNAGNLTSSQISNIHTVPQPVEAVLKSSCYDCHSNYTDYPWYSRIQPISLWLNDHIVDGKKELNFSEFASYSLAKQYRKLEEIQDEVKEDKMPLKSYTLIHRDASLSPAQKDVLMNWVAALRDSMSKNYPADSLIRKKK